MKNIERNYEFWYTRNFEHEDEIKKGVEQNLAKIFTDKEWRIYDIWLNSEKIGLEKRPKSYLRDSLNRMNENLNDLSELPKDIAQISKTLFNVNRSALGKYSINSTENSIFFNIIYNLKTKRKTSRKKSPN